MRHYATSISLYLSARPLRPQAAPAPKPSAVVKEADEDEDIDLFGSDEEDEEAERIKAQRVQEYAAKKAKKPALIAKSSIILDVKPVRCVHANNVLLLFLIFILLK